MAKRTDIPKFGVLSGVKVVSATVSTAGPFAGELMAEMGADVIWIESTLSPDVNRLVNSFSAGLAAESERRNQRTISLNIPSPEGKEVLLKMIEDADIFLEASKGGQYEKWGLTDEVLWERNPRLVIVHLSGFGQSGDPEFIKRASYDPIAQAFSGYIMLQGFEDKDPNPARYLTSDYMAGYCAAVAALGAYINALKTGEGESIDLAQYEATLRCQANMAPEYFNHGVQTKREGSHNQVYAGWGVYKCMDDKYVYLLILGGAIVRKAINILGLEYGGELFPENIGGVLMGTPAAQVLEETIAKFAASHTAEEMENAFWPNGVPCCRIMGYADMIDHPHYKARGSLVQWPAVEGSAYEGQMLTGVASPLRFAKNPTQIWRGCPTIGMDNDDVLEELGFTPEQIQELYDKQVVKKAGPAKKKFEAIKR